jgi:hypothetical protein
VNGQQSTNYSKPIKKIMKTKTYKRILIGILSYWLIGTTCPTIGGLAFAQAPNSFSYQAVLRDASGIVKSNTAATIRVDLLQGSTSGTAVYSESFDTTTNAFGSINLQVGKGTVISGSFSSINWGNGPYFIKISVNGAEMGTSQLLSVPYALYALYAGNVANGVNGNYNDLSDKLTILDTSKHSTATRFQSLYNNTTKAYNSANGSAHTLSGNATGSGNTAYGDGALYSNISGWNNTAIGYYALYSNTIGIINTAVGASSLYHNTTGSSNTANGEDALYSNTTGNSNTANGRGAIYFNTTGNCNTANGNNALYSNTSGSWNTANGMNALYSNTEGASNTAIGMKALYSNTSGYDNTANGNYALYSNTIGAFNTAIGYNADIASSGLNNATAIGANTTVNASNKVRIGSSTVTVIEGQVGFTSASDMRLKKNIKDINTGLEFIMKLRPIEYQMKQGDDKINYGFIAQDIEKLIGVNNSLLTIGGDKDRTLGLRYTDFIAPMVKAMQEQQKQIANQQKEIDLLKEQNKELLELINELKKK